VGTDVDVEDFSIAGETGFGVSPRISDTDRCRIVPDEIRVILPGGDWAVESEAELGALLGVKALFRLIGLSIRVFVSLILLSEEIAVCVSIRMLGLRVGSEGKFALSGVPLVDVGLVFLLVSAGGSIVAASLAGFDVDMEESVVRVGLVVSGGFPLSTSRVKQVSSSGPCSSPGLVVGEPAPASGVFEEPAPSVEAGEDCGSAAVEIGASTRGLRSR
jgi:hypothetical protein